MLIELADIESLKFVIETTTTTSGITNLNNLSKTKQVFIGNLDQYVVLPNTTTLNNGQCFEIINQTTGNTINVKKYDNNSVGSVAKNETLRCICIDKNGTNGNSGWFFEAINRFPKQLTNIDVLASSFSLVSGFYEATISNAAILATHSVEVIPEKAYKSITDAAKFAEETDSFDGSVKIYCEVAPTADFQVTLNLIPVV